MSSFFSWQHAIRSSKLESTTKLVCYTIWSHMASDGTGCFPSYALIADESGLSRRCVIDHVDKAEKAGFLAVDARLRENGSASSNVYRPTMPGSEPAALGGEPSSLGGSEPAALPEDTTSSNNPSSPSVSPKTKASSRAAAKPRLTDFLETSGGVPPVEWGEWAHQQFGWGVERISFEWDDFSDYWNSGNAVGGGRKSDWPATWRSHCRRNSSNSRRGYSAGGKTGSGLAAAFAASVAARHGISPAGGGVGGGQAASGAGENAGAGKPRPPVGELAF